MNEIFWPKGYLPGFSANFASNELIVADLSAVDVWPFLAEARRWPSYYENSANVRFHDGAGPVLAEGRASTSKPSVFRLRPRSSNM